MGNVKKASQESIQSAVDCIRSGGIVVVPTSTNYNLVCSPFNETAVQRVFEAKQRTKFGPLTLYLAAAETIPQYTLATPGFSLELAKELWPGEVSFILYKQEKIIDAVTCGANTIAVACHGQPVLQAIIKGLGHPVCGTSANISGQGDIFVTVEKAIEDLCARVDLIVDDGPTSAAEHPSPNKSNSIVDFSFQPPFLVRKGLIDTETLLQFIPNLVPNTDLYKQALADRLAKSAT